jgi:hypothetical protein
VTAAAQLVQALRARGVTLEPEGDRLRVRPASALSAEELETLRQVKPEVLRLLEAQSTPTPVHRLRAVLRRQFDLRVAEVNGEEPGDEEMEALRQETLKLADEIGPTFAEAVIREEARRFRWETARCGRCGTLGHDGDCGR